MMATVSVHRPGKRVSLDIADDRHARAAWASTLVAKADAEMRVGRNTSRWVRRLGPHLPALRWALEEAESDDPPRFAALVAGLRMYFRRANPSEGAEWLARALALDEAVAPDVLGDLLEGASIEAWESGDARRGFDLAARGVALWRRHSDPTRLARALILAGVTAGAAERWSDAQAALTEARRLGRRTGDPWVRVYATYNLGDLLRVRGDLEAGRRLVASAVRLADSGGFFGLAAAATATLGFIAMAADNERLARRHFAGCAERWSADSPQTALMLAAEGLARLELDAGRVDASLELLRAAEEIRTADGLQLQEPELGIHRATVDRLQRGGIEIVPPTRRRSAPARTDVQALVKQVARRQAPARRGSGAIRCTARSPIR